jgi:hypothetical protein
MRDLMKALEMRKIVRNKVLSKIKALKMNPNLLNHRSNQLRQKLTLTREAK